MFHLDAWHTAITVWTAIGILWIITAAFEHSTPRPPAQRSSHNYNYLFLLIPAALLLFDPQLRLGPLNRALFQSSVLGLALVFAGAAFTGLARLRLGSNWSANPRIREGHTLSTSGPYRIVRHPIYTGILLTSLGTAVILGETRGYIAIVLAFIGYLIKSRMEDRLLAERFGLDFAAYCRRTKALIPGIL
ncbi:MAG TPA: isoprenylcysteine carboxylmethyltransferase family protein [Acidobacteriaceae bacterium]|nr:isoprenylcysteine carboxylmethyltransferase family protein [Acidobacteriaceae bacterium]